MEQGMNKVLLEVKKGESFFGGALYGPPLLYSRQMARSLKIM